MKSLNKILCGCALVTMAASIGVGLSAGEATTVKAEDTSFSVCKVNFRSGDGSAGSYFLQLISPSVGEDYASAAADQKADLTNLNLLDSVHFELDSGEIINLSNVFSGTAYYKHWGDGTGLFLSLNNEIALEKVTRIKRVIIDDGCEMPKLDGTSKFIQDGKYYFGCYQDIIRDNCCKYFGSGDGATYRAKELADSSTVDLTKFGGANFRSDPSQNWSLQIASTPVGTTLIEGYDEASLMNVGFEPTNNKMINLNFMSKIKLNTFDGRTINLWDVADKTALSCYMAKWGDKTFFVDLDETKICGETAPVKATDIKNVVVEEGCEFPSKDFTKKYITDAELSFAFADTGADNWRQTKSGSGSLGHTVIRHKLGPADIEVVADPGNAVDACRNFMWIKVNNPEFDLTVRSKPYTEYGVFQTNMLSHILIDGKSLLDSENAYSEISFNKYDRYGHIGIVLNNIDMTKEHSFTLLKGLEIPDGKAETLAGGQANFYGGANAGSYFVLDKDLTFDKIGEDGSLQKIYQRFNNKFGDQTVTNHKGLAYGELPVVPNVPENSVGYWKKGAKVISGQSIADAESTFEPYYSEIKKVSLSNVGGFPGAGSPTESANIIFKLNDTDIVESSPTDIKINEFETFSSNMEFYDLKGNQLTLTTNGERYSNFRGNKGYVLLQMLDDTQTKLNNVYKVKFKAGSRVPSIALLTTGEGQTYELDKDYTFVRFTTTNDWKLVTEETENIDSKVTAMGMGRNGDGHGGLLNTYNLTIQLDNYVNSIEEGVTNIDDASPLLLLGAKNLHAYNAQNEELTIVYNGCQYSSFNKHIDALYQIETAEIPEKIVLDAGMLVPSNEYVKGEGAMHKLSENAVLIRTDDKSGDIPSYSFVKEYTFDGESVNFAYGQAPDVSKVPTPGTKDSTETTDYTGYWKDSEGNEFDPTAAVTKDMAFTTDFKESARKYNVNYVDENGEAVKTVQVANGSEYTVEAGLTKTGYTGYWTSEDVTIDEDGKFTMPTKDVTLKAAYTANSYTLTCGDETVDVTFDSAIGELPAVPSVEGKHVLGWYIGEEKLEETTVWTFAENKTAEAKYEDHVYEEWTNNGNGTHSSTCECGYVETENHVWGEGVVTTKPTHTTEGEMTYTCTKCDATKTESIPVLTEHDYTDHYVDNEDGLTHEAYCVCNDHVTEDHDWNDGEVTKPATCTENGVFTYTCEDCGATQTEVIPPTGHDWDEGEVTKPATCTENGVMTYTCECGETKTEVIPATGHDWDEGEVTKPATCTENGVMTYTCECGETKTEVIPATGHQLGELIAEVAATTEKEGMKAHYVCSVCGQYFDANKVACTKESLVIAKLPQPTPEPKKGCGGSVIAASAVVTGLAIAGAALIASKKKHD